MINSWTKLKFLLMFLDNEEEDTEADKQDSYTRT